MLASLDAIAVETDVRPALAALAGRDLELDEPELHSARRRALLLLAAGGEPQLGLVLDGRAVTALARELDSPQRRAELGRGLAELEDATGPFARVGAALAELTTDSDLAWRAYACALLAEELEG